MSPFWQAFWGGLLGKIMGAVFIAACAVMWLGPEEWVKWFVSGMAFITPVAARWVFFGLGAMVLLLMAYPAIQRLISGTKKSDYVLLKEAATIAYEEMRGTKAATIIEGPNQDDILGYYARALFKGKTLYGNRPPSRKLEAIPNEEYGRCGISDDQNALWRRADSRILYENLQIKRSDLDRRIDELKSAAAALQNEASEKSELPSWFDLEQRFRELEAPLQFTRIDGQTGAAGEHWRLAGGPSGDAGRRFRAVAAMASARLFRDFPSEVRRHPNLESETDPVIRWYKALRFIGERYEEDLIAEQVNDDGTSGGFIYSGSIGRPATASATLCLELASRPVEQA